MKKRDVVLVAVATGASMQAWTYAPGRTYGRSLHCQRTGLCTESQSGMYP